MHLNNDQLLDLFNMKVVTLSDGRQAIPKATKKRDVDSYGEYEYYSDEDIWVVFQVGETYYKQHGYQPSWGGAVFDGEVFEVTPTIKTIEVWD